jgi:nitrate reductase NapE component
LQTLRRVSGTSRESVVREAFKTLLKDWGKSRDLIFIPEYEYATQQKTRVYAGNRVGRCRCVRAGSSVDLRLSEYRRRSFVSRRVGRRLFSRRDRPTLGRQSFAEEAARMNTFAFLAIAWIPVAVAIVIGFAFFLGWLDDRAERRKAHHAAE